MTITIPNFPITEKFDEFEKEYKRTIQTYITLRTERENKEADLEFKKSGELLRLISNASKITEAERIISINPEFFSTYKMILDLKRQEKMYEMYQKLLDHKASFLTTLGRLTKSELDKTALRP